MYAAEIVVRKNGANYVAGFASKTRGQRVASFGEWYGSQMDYKPFRAAMAAAEAMAAKLNAKTAKA